MFIQPESIEHSFRQDRANKVQPVSNGESFERILNQLAPEAVVNSAFESKAKQDKRKRRDTDEMMEEYNDDKADLFDVLDLQSKIQKVFRKVGQADYESER